MELVKVNQKDPKSSKDSIFKDFIRFARNATQGIGQATETEAKDLLKRLSKQGLINVEQEAKLLKTLTGHMKQSRERFEERVMGAVQTASKKLLEVSTKELSRLEKHIQELEKKVEKTSKFRK